MYYKFKKLRPFVILILAASAYFIRGAGRDAPALPVETEEKKEVLGAYAGEFFPAAEDFTGKNGLFRVECAGGDLLGYVVTGPPADARITGYAGEVPFLAALSSGMEIKGVVLLPSEETPGYAARVEERLGDAWTGLSPDEAMMKRVDAVTGATQTSEALIAGVRESMREISGGGLFHHSVRGAWAGGFTETLAILFLAAALSAYFFRFKGRLAGHALSAAGVLVPGVLAASLMSLSFFATLLRGNASWARHWLLIFIVSLAAGFPLVSGRNFYCLYFCPYGHAQRLFGKLGRKKLKPGGRVFRAAAMFRLFMIFSAFFIFVAGTGIQLAFLEPFAAFRWNFAPLSSRILAVSFLVLAVFVPMPWCRICPTGGILDGLKTGGLHSLRRH